MACWSIPTILALPTGEGGRCRRYSPSGHHANIEQWRREESLRRTATYRPDMSATAPLTKKDQAFLEQLAQEPALRETAQEISEPFSEMPDKIKADEEKTE